MAPTIASIALRSLLLHGALFAVLAIGVVLFSDRSTAAWALIAATTIGMLLVDVVRSLRAQRNTVAASP